MWRTLYHSLYPSTAQQPNTPPPVPQFTDHNDREWYLLRPYWGDDDTYFSNNTDDSDDDEDDDSDNDDGDDDSDADSNPVS